MLNPDDLLGDLLGPGFRLWARKFRLSTWYSSRCRVLRFRA